MTGRINLLSIIIPAFNEESTIINVLENISRVEIAPVKKEVIIVDDHSTDNTVKVIEQFIKVRPDIPIKLIKHELNYGKGSAVHTGIGHSNGDCLIIQDADLEYNPNEYKQMIDPIDNGYADVVYGSRFMGSNPHRILFFWHTVGNRFLTFLSNIFTNLNLTDMETGYKSFRAEVIKNIKLNEKRFGFEPEVTAKFQKFQGSGSMKWVFHIMAADMRKGKK